MDLFCPQCGEPWEQDSLHDEAAARSAAGIPANYTMVAVDFRDRGCEAMHAGFSGKHGEVSTETDRTYGLTRQAAAAAMYEILGDDMDGAAAMLDDLGF